MAHKAEHTNQPELDDLLDQFSADEQDTIKELWEITPHAETSHADPVSEQEIEQALESVHSRISGSDQQTGASNITPFNTGWRWIAAAAAIVLLIGTGILFTQETARAPYGEITTVELPDGSSIELNSGSEISYNRLFSFTNRTIHLEGEAFFSVKSGELPFLVKAHNASVKVTGTKFNVRSWSGNLDGETEVTVSEGNVQFYPAGREQQAVTVRPGQLSRLTESLVQPTPPETVSVDRVMGWRKHNLVFKKEPLVTIFRKLERRYNVDIRLENRAAATETLTNYYPNPKDVESILQDICRLKGLEYAETANGYRVY